MSKNSWGEFVDCLVSENMFKTGMGYVVITRRKSSLSLRCVAFLVDIYCLGVKDCFLRKCNEEEYQVMKEDINAHAALKAVTPSYAKKLIEGAVAYAKDLGIEPHADFERNFNSLNDIDSSECKDSILFGNDGKPMFIPGPNDSPAKVERIMRSLTNKKGEGNFDYMKTVSI